MKLKLLILLTLVGCAYFNTYYNAEQYFEKGENIRMENAGTKLPAAAIDAYSKVIEKTNKVLEEYPDSKYREPAILLMGKAYYHKKDYVNAELRFKLLQADPNSKYLEDAAYWLALCKWKFGKTQAALDDLSRILSETRDKRAKTTIHLSLANIYLELNNNKLAFSHLEEAARLSRTDAERGQIYVRLANLAYEKKEWKRALKSYRNVIKYSLSKKHVENANLMIVRLYRMLGDLDKAGNRIKIMLLDDSFKSIWSELELELAKLYQEQGRTEEALTRLASITESYPRTPAAAEAYYLLGEHQLMVAWDLENARKYYQNVKRESRKSEFGSAADLKVKEISAYLDTWKKIRDQLKKSEIPETDSTLADTTATIPEQVPEFVDLSPLYMTLGELEAFHFQQPDSAIIHFGIVAANYPEAAEHTRALFTLAYLLEQKGDTTAARENEDLILALYPKSDYAVFIRKKRGMEETVSSSASLLNEAEALREQDIDMALYSYLNILSTDSSSESSLLAGFFIADYYDKVQPDPEKAIHYYQWVSDHFAGTDQAAVSQERMTFIRRILEAAATPDSTKEDSLD